MLSYFRRLRQSLLSEGLLKRYLMYIGGEIFLVVAGILIALQINDWSERQKLKALEISTLQEIRSSLVKSIEEIDMNIKGFQGSAMKIQNLLTHLKAQRPFADSLQSHFIYIGSWPSPQFNFTAYKNLGNRGLELISNEALKNEIVDVYEIDLIYLIEDLDKYIWNFNSTVVTPALSKRIEFLASEDGFPGIPNDYQALLKDQEFINILQLSILSRRTGITSTQSIRNNISQLIQDIDTELQSLQL